MNSLTGANKCIEKSARNLLSGKIVKEENH